MALDGYGEVGTTVMVVVADTTSVLVCLTWAVLVLPKHIEVAAGPTKVVCRIGTVFVAVTATEVVGTTVRVVVTVRVLDGSLSGAQGALDGKSYEVGGVTVVRK